MLTPTSRWLFPLLFPALLAAWWLWRTPESAPIRIGVLHAQTGVMAENEKELIDSLRFAVEEINATGGLLGRRVDLVLADTRSDDQQAASEAERLIREVGVHALFGCWTSSCRRSVRPVVERHQHLLFYALQYEGLEDSGHLVYLGAAPNQQIIPGTRWATEQFGKRLYLIGSDYIFPRAANVVIQDVARANGARILAERYVPMQATDFRNIAGEIQRQSPDVIFNTLNGEANRHFFNALAHAGLTRIPVVSFSIGEPELQHLAPHPKHYAVWGYFQNLDTPQNREFVRNFQARYGMHRVLSDPMLSSYHAVKLWAAAVTAVGSDDPAQVRTAIGRVSITGATGPVALDPGTRHAWRRVYIGHAQQDGQFAVGEISSRQVRPVPFPDYRSVAEWTRIVGYLNHQHLPASPGNLLRSAR